MICESCGFDSERLAKVSTANLGLAKERDVGHTSWLRGIVLADKDVKKLRAFLRRISDIKGGE